MNRLKALEAVAEAARQFKAARAAVPVRNYVAETYRLEAAVDALDALPADPEPARGEVVELAVWEHNDGEIQMVRCDTEGEGYTDGVGGWTRLGTTRLPLGKGDGA
jgi:hypothetical protein